MSAGTIMLIALGLAVLNRIQDGLRFQSSVMLNQAARASGLSVEEIAAVPLLVPVHHTGKFHLRFPGNFPSAYGLLHLRVEGAPTLFVDGNRVQLPVFGFRAWSFQFLARKTLVSINDADRNRFFQIRRAHKADIPDPFRYRPIWKRKGYIPFKRILL